MTIDLDNVQSSRVEYRPLEWARMKNTPEREDWVAHSLDGERMYSINIDRSDTSRVNYWRLAWKAKGDKEIHHEAYTFLNRHEAQNVADLLESQKPIDPEKLAQSGTTFAMTVAGNEWKYLGLHVNKRTWVSVQEGGGKAFVAIYDYDHPDVGWVITEREWKSIGHEQQKLNIKELGKYKELETAMQSVALLTYSSSASANESLKEAPTTKSQEARQQTQKKSGPNRKERHRVNHYSRSSRLQ